MSEYEALKKRLAHGWNTWNTRSVLAHVLLPEAFALNVCFKTYSDGNYLREALIGREEIYPGPHTYDGSYTELRMVWNGLEVIVQSARTGDDLVLLVTPLRNEFRPATLVIEAAVLWNRDGCVQRRAETLAGQFQDHEIVVHATEKTVDEPHTAAQGPYLAMTLAGAAGISTGKPRTLAEIQEIVRERRAENQVRIEAYGELAETYKAIQGCLAWDTIYDPSKDRVISTVSRIWNGAQGYILFCWDAYFAAYIAAIDNKEIAYANAIEITREKTDDGFVPNVAMGAGFKSLDRSQPPVGSMVVRELYRRYGDEWLLQELFDDLLSWNRWWPAARSLDGLLAWGSNPFEQTAGHQWEMIGVNERGGGALESGLDNSPLYDDIPFDKERHVLMLADVGLTGLYVMDCDALAEIAGVLGRTGEAAELRGRADMFSRNLTGLWDTKTEFFLNRRSDTGEFSERIGPPNFYALLGRAATPEQAERMMTAHFYNPEEFWGEWILPSIARNDPAYPEQDYWRGRIWAPMNILVYLGLRKYGLKQACADLSEKSRALLMKEWLARGHIHENYCADTGEGCNSKSSDPFYHWGGLLGLISFIEAGVMDGPEKPLRPA